MATQEQQKAYRAFYASGAHRLRPDVCQQCNTKPVYDALQAHHDDYSKPLDVRWLCRSCHVRHHDSLRRAVGRSARKKVRLGV